MNKEVTTKKEYRWSSLQNLKNAKVFLKKPCQNALQNPYHLRGKNRIKSNQDERTVFVQAYKLSKNKKFFLKRVGFWGS